MGQSINERVVSVVRRSNLFLKRCLMDQPIDQKFVDV